MVYLLTADDPKSGQYSEDEGWQFITLGDQVRFLIIIGLTGFVRALEILESPGILFWHFPGLESPGKLMQVLESPGNL